MVSNAHVYSQIWPLATLTGDQVLGDIFYTGALGYFAQMLGMGHILARTAQYRWNLTPSIGTFGYVPTVSYIFGFPLSISPGPIEVDIDRVGVVTAALNNDKPARLNAVRQLGTLSSALEHIVPEQLFVNAQNPGEAVSAVKALTKANAAGQRVYTLTAANQAETLPHIHHDAGTMAEIRAALAAGLTVITHTDTVSVPGWSGAGYALMDPLTGDGAYKISGGMNGGLVWFVAALASFALPVLFVIFLFGGGVSAILFAGFFAVIGMLFYVDAIMNIVKAVNDGNIPPKEGEQVVRTISQIVIAANLAAYFKDSAFGVSVAASLISLIIVALFKFAFQSVVDLIAWFRENKA